MTQAAPVAFGPMIAPGVEAVRRNWRPFVAIQAVALACVLLYFNSESAQDVAGTLAAWRNAAGVLGAMLVTAVAGAILPEIARRLTQPGHRFNRERFGETSYLFVVFFLNGGVVDYFYRTLAWLFGASNDPVTVAKKVACDMLIFSPVIALPLIALAFGWRRHRYRVGPTLGELSPRWYARRVVPMLLPAWAYWTPMVCMIYSLPTELQFVLFAFAMAAWSLVLVFIGSAES